MKGAGGESVTKGPFSSFQGILNVEESPVTPLALTPLYWLPLFMRRSTAWVQPGPLTLHATHSFTGPAYSNTPPGAEPRGDSCVSGTFRSAFTERRGRSTQVWSGSRDKEERILQRFMWKLACYITI